MTGPDSVRILMHLTLLTEPYSPLGIGTQFALIHLSKELAVKAGRTTHVAGSASIFSTSDKPHFS